MTQWLTTRIHLLTGSKAEFHKYSRQITEGRPDRTIKRVYQTKDLAMWSPVLYIAGTGVYTKNYKHLCEVVETRSGVIHFYDLPGTVWVPSLEIAHEFAEHLGIDPEWRYGSEE